MKNVFLTLILFQLTNSNLRIPYSFVSSLSIQGISSESNKYCNKYSFGIHLHAKGDDYDDAGLLEDDDEFDDYVDKIAFDEVLSLDEVDMNLSLLEADYPKGTEKDYRIVQQYRIPQSGFDLKYGAQRFNDIRNVLQRVNMTNYNVTLPVALMLSDSDQFPTLSNARKAIRKGSIILYEGYKDCSDGGFDVKKAKRGKADTRVGPNDLIARQVLMPDGVYSGMVYAKPGFDLPVIFEDDHVAIVNKPSGIPIFASRGVGHRRITIEAILPFVLKPPHSTILGKLKYPQPAHRLDKPTSGLLVVAKTKQAIVNLSEQFEKRIVKKSYKAIINGIPDEESFSKMSGQAAFEMGAYISGEIEFRSDWNFIEHSLEGKSAITFWRSTGFSKSLKATNQTLTSVDLKLKTGRKHQLRRHLAWVVGNPIVGDKTYDSETPSSVNLRGNGLFLCSDKVLFQHPYYNTKEGRIDLNKRLIRGDKVLSGHLFEDENDGIVYVKAEIPIPNKFISFLDREEERFNRLNS